MPNRTQETKTLPSFSIILETENLATADLDYLQRCLESLANQTLSATRANEFLLIDTGQTPAEIQARLKRDFPWVTVFHGSGGYYEVKQGGVRETTGDLVVFCDSDCKYEPQWLESMVTSFVTLPDAEVVAGQTTVEVGGPYSLATTLSWSFPPFARRRGLYENTNYLANNVAFRRQVLLELPIPADLPIYRGNCAIHCMALNHAGKRIFTQPEARAVHPLPGDLLRHFFWRWMVHGHDQLLWFRLGERMGFSKKRHPLLRDGITALRLISLGTYKPLRRLPPALRDSKWALLYLPLAMMLVGASSSCALLGWFFSLFDEEVVLRQSKRRLLGAGH